MNRELISVIIETERLLLFPYDSDSLALFNSDLSAFEERYGLKYEGEELDDGLRAFLRDLERQIAEDPDNMLFFTEFLITVKETDTVIGSIDYKYAPKDGVTEVGYGLGPGHSGHGYMTEALAAFLEFGRSLGISKVLADTERGNTASQNVLKKCGFRFLREDRNLWWERDIMQVRVLPEINIELEDTEWPFTYTDHDRNIVRAIVFDDEGFLYFVRASRDDDFGKAVFLETSGGGVEPGEDLETAIKRELKEELGAETEIVCRIGTVIDYYNLVHRHNINNYFLCRALSFGERHLMPDEIEDYHLVTVKTTYRGALEEYDKRAVTRIGRLMYSREVPILKRAGEMLGLEADADEKDI